MGISPAEHYLRVGEAAGLAPSDEFDPAFYAARNPDIGATSLNRLLHYVQYGRAEGRRCLPFARIIEVGDLNLDPNRSTVAVAVHDSSRTGAPILAWNIVQKLKERYNVIVLLKRGGVIEDSFECPHLHLIRCFERRNEFLDEVEISEIVDKLCRLIKIDYVIANSVETRQFVPGFERNGVPVVVLVHEFSAYTRPQGVLWRSYSTASEIVFSSRITVESSLNDYHPLHLRSYHIIPQGPSAIPPCDDATFSPSPQQPELPIAADTFLVIGMGAVQIRKGVDLFVSVAAEVRRMVPEAPIRFLWIGGGYEPERDLQYSVYLREQLQRSGFDESMMVAEVDDLAPYFRRAQLFLLSSRLDRQPIVAIDAMMGGLPVVSFDGASGIADLLRADAATAQLVVPHLSIDAAARAVIGLHDNPSQLAQLRTDVERLARASFDMTRYVETLDSLGQSARGRMERVLAAETTMLGSGRVNLDLLRNVEDQRLPADAAIRQYLIASKNFSPWSRSGTGDWLRRPLAGFHPLIYAAECPGFDEIGDEDPSAHFLRSGRPDGRWTHAVIEPGDAVTAGPAVTASLHGHFHYPELLSNFLDRLATNASRCDLYITTTDTEREDALLAILADRAVEATVTVVPNKGRDLGPFLTELLPSLINQYEIVGHIHGKRSLRLGFEFGERWREFLWQHLIGDNHPMMDRVFDAFSRDDKLGLIFPLDPHLIGWSKNRKIAELLAAQMGISKSFPAHFDFPVGTMFWARTNALRPLLNLGLRWGDYPREPIDDDGTMLHALERLIPMVVEAAGYKFATTFVAGVRR